MLKSFQILFLILVALAGCSTTHNAEILPASSGAQQGPTSLSIRSLDFGNFSYPAEPVCSARLKSFTLKNGKFGDGHDCHGVALVYLDYGDATGDGADEAIAVISTAVKGSAIPYYVYIYALDEQKPKLLWAFATGDRADGGLRQIQARGGELTIDLYGKEKIIGRNLYADDGTTAADCCPTHFTRAHYKWRQNIFIQSGGTEVLPNPGGGAPVIMPRYEPRV